MGGGIQVGGFDRDRRIGCLRRRRQSGVRLVRAPQSVVHAAQRQMAIRFPDAGAVPVAQVDQRLFVRSGVVQLRSQSQTGAPVELPGRAGVHDLPVELGGALVLAARAVDAADAIDRLQRLGSRPELPQIREYPERTSVLVDGDRGIGHAQQPGHRHVPGTGGSQHGGRVRRLRHPPQPLPGVERRLRVLQRLPRPRQNLQRLRQARMIGKPLREVLQRGRALFQRPVLDQQIGTVQDGACRQAGVRPVTGILQRLQP